jgi:hypothetical protein
VGLLRQLHLESILETHLGSHGNTHLQMAVDNGVAVLVWLVYLLSAGDHRKVVVADWVAQHAAVLSAAVGTPVTASDFSDDRLSTLLSGGFADRYHGHPAAGRRRGPAGGDLAS